MVDNATIELLNYLHDKYNRESFIEADPISVPHCFEQQEDIEIAGFMASAIAWGNRKAIVKSAHRMMSYMGNEPYRFIMDASAQELDMLTTYVHRTFNGNDFRDFIVALRGIYAVHGNMGSYFEHKFGTYGDMRIVLSYFRKDFLSTPHGEHCTKHLSNIDKGAACKRLCMFLRWMVRKDNRNVDFGLWNIPASALYLPLDVHSGNVARALGLLKRRQSDWKAVEEVTAILRAIDPTDPVRYDFALFGAGIEKDEHINIG